MSAARRAGPALLAVLVCLAGVPALGAQERAAVSPDSADALRAAMERPPNDHGISVGHVVNAPLKLVGVPLGWTVRALLAAAGFVTTLEAVEDAGTLLRELPRAGLHPSLSTGLGPRSGIGAGIRYDGLAPFEVGTAWSIHGSQRHEVALRFGGDVWEAAFSGYFRRHAREKFWGIGSDTREEAGADFEWDQIGGIARAEGAVGGVSVAGVLGFEENGVGRGNDGSVVDLQDAFDTDALFGARMDTRFVRIAADLTAEFLDRDTLRITGLRVRAGVERFDGVDGTESDFTRLAARGEGLVPLGLRHTLALSGEVEVTRDVAGPVPFTHLPTLGGGPGLRAYDSGRFRDRDLFALGTELRYEVWRELRERGRGELFLFWETGGVGPSLGDIPTTHDSYGFGVLVLWVGTVVGDAYVGFGEDGTRVSASLSLGAL